MATLQPIICLVDRPIELWRLINPNTTIASIIDIGLLKGGHFVGGKEYLYFKPGMRVKIEVEAFPNNKGTFEP